MPVHLDPIYVKFLVQSSQPQDENNNSDFGQSSPQSLRSECATWWRPLTNDINLRRKCALTKCCIKVFQKAWSVVITGFGHFRAINGLLTLCAYPRMSARSAPCEWPLTVTGQLANRSTPYTAYSIYYLLYIANF